MINLPPGLILIAGAVLLPFIPRNNRSAMFILFPALTFFYLLSLNQGDSLTVPFLTYTLTVLRVDLLSLCFGYVFVLVTFFGGVYGYHLKDVSEQVAALLYAGSALGVVFAGDFITLICFWELMAVSSVYLIWVRGTPLSHGAGMRYLIVHFFGGSVLLAGIVINYHETGSILFNHMDGGIASYLVLFSFCLNAAVPPLHAWLSDAYPEGTVTGSVFLSAFTTKTAVYVLARGFAGWDILIWAGAIMTVYGVIYAFMENDGRRILAYHIISQVGYMVCGVGIGTAAAISGTVAHAFAHVLYKALLFMGAGAVLYATGKSKLSDLGGLAKAMPFVLGLYMIGAFSISGFPLLSGFVSKSLVIDAAALSHMDWVVLCLNLASIGTFLSVGLKLPYFTSFAEKKFLMPSKVPTGMYIGMGLTALACFVIGVYPSVLYNILPYPVHYNPYSALHIVETLQLLLFTGLAFWAIVKVLVNKPVINLDFDWFYRRPVYFAYKVFVAAPARFFGFFEQAAFMLVGQVEEIIKNPLGYIMKKVAMPGIDRRDGKAAAADAHTYSPDKYRFSAGAMMLIVIICFIMLISWSMLNA